MSLISRTLVHEAIYNAIKTALDGSGLLEVYGILPPQDEALPYARYNTFGDIPQYSISDDESLDIQVQVSYFGKEEDGSADLFDYADILIAALDRVNNVIDIDGYNNSLVFFTTAGTLTFEDGDILQLRQEFNLQAY